MCRSVTFFFTADKKKYYRSPPGSPFDTVGKQNRFFFSTNISRHFLAPHTVLASVLTVTVQMCNSSDWIHCNKNPTLHRHPQNRNQSRGCPSKLAEKEPDHNFQLLLENKEKTSFFLSSCSFIWFSRTSFHVFKTWNQKTVVGKKKIPPSFHLLPVLPPPPHFFPSRNFHLLVSSCQHSALMATYRGKYASTKINEKGTCCKEPHFHRVWDGQDGTPLQTWGGGRGRRPQRPVGLPGHPGQCKAVSNLKARREITFRESGAFGFCAQRAAGSGGRRRFRGSRRPSSSPRRRWAAPRSSSAARSQQRARPPRLCFWPTSP